MDSPPSTPPAELGPPSTWRFEETFDGSTELSEYYKPGGLHPVSIGDIFNSGTCQYRVIRKLGNGAYSTVWLASSAGTSALRYVALKVMVAKASSSTTELSIQSHLSKVAAPGNQYAQHVTTLYDDFLHHGPNGEHRCLVFHPMGATVDSFIWSLYDRKLRISTDGDTTFEPSSEYPPISTSAQDDEISAMEITIPKRSYQPTYPLRIVKRILLHTLRGLAFLHRNGVAHGDLQPGNLLFTAKDIQSIPEDRFEQDDTTAIHLKRVDGKIDRWAPSKLYRKQPLVDFVDISQEGLAIQISDLGAAFWSADPPAKTLTPTGLRAPEVILEQPFDYRIDIWSFGCLLFEFLTSSQLFAIPGFGYSREEADDEHLVKMYEILAPLPDSMMAVWPRARQWFEDKTNKRLNPYDDSEPWIHDSLEQMFDANRTVELGDEEAKVVKSLLRQILQYDPAKRPSAEELLQHPWFTATDS